MDGVVRRTMQVVPQRIQQVTVVLGADQSDRLTSSRYTCLRACNRDSPEESVFDVLAGKYE